jgi:hypothetical protein
LPESRSDGRKLASYEVAGNAPDKFTRPERTMDSAIPPGRNHFGTANRARCAGLIFSVAPRQFQAVAQIIFNREIRENRIKQNSFAYFAWFAVHFFVLKNLCFICVHPAFAACFGGAGRG